MLLSLLLDFGIPFVAAAISWWLGVYFNLSVLLNGIVTLVSALTVFVFLLAYRFAQTKAQITRKLAAFEAAMKDTNARIVDFTTQANHERRILKLLSNYIEAIRGFEGLPREVLFQELSLFEDLVKRAADGSIDVRTPSRSILSYEGVFKTAQTGSHIKATALLLPSEKFKEHILEVNKAFLARGGKISRIFILPKDKAQATPWQDYINEQKKLGVNVAFAFEEDISHELCKDMLILDKPLIATHAMLGRAGKDYEMVTIITNPQKVTNLINEWEQLDVKAYPFKSEDCVVKMLA